jgi:hypothetical protein
MATTLKVLDGSIQQTIKYAAIESHYCEQTLNDFKDHIGKLTGNTEVPQSTRIPAMAELCDTVGLRKVYYAVLEAYLNEVVRNEYIRGLLLRGRNENTK